MFSAGGLQTIRHLRSPRLQTTATNRPCGADSAYFRTTWCPLAGMGFWSANELRRRVFAVPYA